MRIISLDPGAERSGWAVLETGPAYLFSGYVSYPRGDYAFQKYKLDLIDCWQMVANKLLDQWQPDAVVSETVPSRGANIPEQLYLANTQITAFHTVAFERKLPIYQVSARTVQKAIALRGKSKGITKPQVRKGVLLHFPELKKKFSENMKVFEESDAIAIGLWFLDTVKE